MAYQNIMNASLFDFEDIKKSKVIIKTHGMNFEPLWQMSSLDIMKSIQH